MYRSLMFRQVFIGVDYFLLIMHWLVIAYWVLSLFRPNFRLFVLLERFLNPLLRPFRILNMKLMAKLQGGRMLDFSIWMALIAINILRRLLWSVFYGI